MHASALRWIRAEMASARLTYRRDERASGPPNGFQLGEGMVIAFMRVDPFEPGSVPPGGGGFTRGGLERRRRPWRGVAVTGFNVTESRALEVEIHRDFHPDRDRLVVAQRRLEHPLFDRIDRRGVETRDALDDLHVLHAAVLADENVERDLAGDAGVAREFRVRGGRRRDRHRLILVVDELPFARKVVARSDDEGVLPGP